MPLPRPSTMRRERGWARPRPARRMRLASEVAAVVVALLLMAATLPYGGPGRGAWLLEWVLLRPTAAPAPAATAPVQWKQDLRYLSVNLPRLHANAFHTLTHEAFDEAVARAMARADVASDAEMTAHVMRILALVGDGHTTTNAWNDRVTKFPVRIVHAGGSWSVIGASAPHRDLLAAELVAIDERPVDEVAAALAPLTSADSRQHHRARVARMMPAADLLHVVGITRDEGEADFRFRRADGSEETRRLTTADPAAGIHYADTPLLFRSELSAMHFVRWLEDEGAVYLRYRRCRDAEGFDVLAREVFDLLDRHPSAPLVVDLRGNGGGDSRIMAPLLRGLRARGAGERTVVLIDADTYSSATMNAHDLRRAGATLVGEPTGDALGGWGEVRSFVLPNSGIDVRVSTYRFGGDETPLRPDVPVTPTVRDWLEGRDPVLEAALAVARR